MLGSRLSDDTLSRARLSHAIRSNTSEADWLFVSSANLDELLQQPLPGVPQQLDHLTRWLAAQLGDDRLGRVPCPWPETLAGIVGAADGDRVSRLIEYAVKQKIVEHDANRDVYGLTPEGWAMTEPPQETEKPVQQRASKDERETIVKAHCNVCGGEKNAFRRASHTVAGSDGEVSWSDTYEVLECCGCNGMAVRHSYWFSEWDMLDQHPITGQPRRTPGVKVVYWPPPTKRKKPDWADDLEDEMLRQVMDEVYQALNGGLTVIASIGTETLLDRAMYRRVGDPKGGFRGKLDTIVHKGHIGLDERKTLEAMTDAGNAAAHRGFSPKPEMLNTIVTVVENFMHREFVLKTAAGQLGMAIPARAKSSTVRIEGSQCTIRL